MTYDEFLQRLAETPRDWWLMPHFNAIRRGGPPDTANCVQCPISACDNRPSMYWATAARTLELTDADRLVIYNAADDYKADPRVRADLLRACGLET